MSDLSNPRNVTPKNAALHASYVKNCREQDRAPIVEDVELSQIVKKMFRDNASVGNGSSAAALRHEMSTGEAVGGRQHQQKCAELLKCLARWIETHPGASRGDIQTAESLILDLQNVVRTYLDSHQDDMHAYRQLLESEDLLRKAWNR